MTDAAALDLIAHWLRDPDWGVGMLEDIAAVVSTTGRDCGSVPDTDCDRAHDPDSAFWTCACQPVATWARH